jgi:hypothetical protein
MNADHQGSAPSFEEDSGVLGVKKELNCVPILLRLMQKGVYSSYTQNQQVARSTIKQWSVLKICENSRYSEVHRGDTHVLNRYRFVEQEMHGENLFWRRIRDFILQLSQSL